jgi:hypothetical protein
LDFDGDCAQEDEKRSDVSDEILSPTLGFDVSPLRKTAGAWGPADGAQNARGTVELPEKVDAKKELPEKTESQLPETQLTDLQGKAMRLQSLEKQVSDARKEICELEKKITSLQEEAKELSSTIEFDAASGFRWEFQKSNGEWSEFPGVVAAILMSAYAKFEYGGPAEVVCNTGAEQLSFDFAEMTLTNIKTGEVQRIQCALDVTTLCYRAIRRRSKNLADQCSRQADQSITDTRTTNSKFKTERCKFHMQGKCRYGLKCSYAHNEEELRTHLDNQPDSPGASCIGCMTASAA